MIEAATTFETSVNFYRVNGKTTQNTTILKPSERFASNETE
jgi:hypothetical protein